MPGISAIFKKAGSKPLSADLCSRIRTGMLHFPFYASRQIIAEEWANIGFTGYEEYPLTIINNKEYTLILEGRIYNLEKDSLDQTLTTLAEAQIRSDATCDETLKQFLLAAEGEFVIIIYDKAKKRMILANDIMGRLPLYCFQDAESCIVSRELKFILPFLPRVKFNKNGILEYLLYGFPFEENTFVETVGFFPAATWVCFDLVSGESVRESYHSMNFDMGTHTGDRKKTAADMCRIFMDGLSDRAAWVDKNRTIVSLSGGFDSRATLAGMKKLGLCPTAVTAQSEEEGAAREVAGFMGAEVYAIPQGHVETERSFADIVFLKDGLDCHPNLAQLYQNLKVLRDEFGGDVVYFTGIYGGEITRHSHITAGLSSLDSLAHYLLNANDSYKYSTEKVAAILQVPQKEIKEQLEHYLKKLPEENICRKYARFRHEYDTRFAGEAEDRNRYYFWTISPFFSFPFFTYCMGIDENRKTSWLFRDFLFALDPNTCKAKYFNYGLPLTIPFVLWCLAVAEGLVRHVVVKNSLKRIRWLVKTCKRLIVRPPVEEARAIDGIRIELIEALEHSKPVRDFFVNLGLRDLIMSEDDSRGLDRLRIVFAYLDTATRWHARFNVKSTV